jgi:AcrR family transcriptional regulator
MTRLTRSQVQEQNRETLLRIARAAFLRDGYVATSLAAVAKEAGFTTGIVYSSFGSKADLALGVLTMLQAEEIADLAHRVSDPTSTQHVLDRVRDWAVAATASGWVRFELELLLDTINDRRLAAAQTARQEAAVEQATVVMRALVPPGSVDDEVVSIVAEAAVDYAIGVAIRQVANPSASPDRFLLLMAPLVAGLMSTAGPQPE